jgi:hypothetical protein
MCQQTDEVAERGGDLEVAIAFGRPLILVVFISVLFFFFVGLECLQK